MAQASSRQELLQKLRKHLRGMSGEAPRQVAEESEDPQPLAGPQGPLEALLPSGKKERGMLMEWLTENEGSGTLSLALLLAAEKLEAARVLVVVDAVQEFYPPVVASLGISLSQLIVLRPRSHPDLLWGLEQSLRCPGVSAVVCRLGKVDPRAYRRLQLAVESGGGLGMLVRPDQHLGEPSWADVKLRVSASSEAVARNLSEARRLHVEVLHCRAGARSAAVDLEICDDPVRVRLVPRLAPAKTVRRPARA